MKVEWAFGWKCKGEKGENVGELAVQKTNAENQTPTLPSPRKLPAVTQVPTFQTAHKMMSQRHIVAGPVSAKKNNCILLPFFY